MKKVVIYGVGDNYIHNVDFLESCFEIVGLADGNPKKQGTIVNGIRILKGEDLSSLNYDAIIVTPNSYLEIIEELVSDGILRDKIIVLSELLDNEPTGNRLNVLFYVPGGLGDELIGVNYIWKFINHFRNYNIDLSLATVGDARQLESLISGCIDYDKIIHCTEEAIPMLGYDLVIWIKRYPNVLKSDMTRIAYIIPPLVDLLLQYEKFKIFNPRFFTKNFEADGISALYEVNNGKKRINQPDIYELLGITEEYECPIKVDDSLLKEYGLNDKKYITIHRGCNKKNYEDDGTKIWPSDNYEILINNLKSIYSDYIIALVGEEYEHSDRITGYDVSLLGKTSVSELAAVLKNSSLHIDTEGGLVHLRHAVRGGTSVVLFGPTSNEFFGYSENINIRTQACKIPCEWTHMNWNRECINNSHKNRCMQSITPELVINEITHNWKG